MGRLDENDLASLSRFRTGLKSLRSIRTDAGARSAKGRLSRIPEDQHITMRPLHSVGACNNICHINPCRTSDS